MELFHLQLHHHHHNHRLHHRSPNLTDGSHGVVILQPLLAPGVRGGLLLKSETPERRLRSSHWLASLLLWCCAGASRHHRWLINKNKMSRQDKLQLTTNWQLVMRDSQHTDWNKKRRKRDFVLSPQLLCNAQSGDLIMKKIMKIMLRLVECGHQWVRV